eukprot:GEMP01062585.1.p1 GENE.GEMP01062585.1~~GEMP01062585.1.p1  ORF type:complete len:195 (+),score=24.96 GEMP01062585.1:511-1095(+)
MASCSNCSALQSSRTLRHITVHTKRFLANTTCALPDLSNARVFSVFVSASILARCRYCAIMPGDGNTAQRVFDAMAKHCVPVFLYHPDSYVVLPFLEHIPWLKEVGLHYQVDSAEGMHLAIQDLLKTPHNGWLKQQKAVRWAAPRVAMELQGCPAEQPSALTLMVADLERKKAYLRDNWPVGFGSDFWFTFKLN